MSDVHYIKLIANNNPMKGIIQEYQTKGIIQDNPTKK